MCQCPSRGPDPGSTQSYNWAPEDDPCQTPVTEQETAAALPRTADAVVIGGGSLGTSICHRLAKAGLSTVLIERRGLASGCTGTTVALVNASSKGPPAHYTALNFRSTQLYRELAGELGADIGFQGNGNMPLVAETEEEMAEARRLAALRNEVPGLNIEALDAKAAREIVPALSPDIAGALYCAQDGCVDSFKLVTAQAAAARAHGAHIAIGATVTGILTEHGRISGVVTDRGPISTPTIVIAAGIHTPAIGEMAGVRIPVMAKRGQIVTTEPLPPMFPIPVGQLRQMAWSSVIIGTTYEDAGYTRATETLTLAALAGRAVRVFPGLAGASAMRFWAGLRPWPADGISILGQTALDGLYAAATHSGITLAPVVGIAMAELISDGQASVVDLVPFSPTRFDSPQTPGAPGEDFCAFWEANRRGLARV